GRRTTERWTNDRHAASETTSPNPSLIRRGASHTLAVVHFPTYSFGTFLRSSSSQTVASLSLGARQSPRGERLPPEPTLGLLGTQLRLNWLVLKKRQRKTSSHFLMMAKSYWLC